jgi:predicted lipoprotein
MKNAKLNASKEGPGVVLLACLLMSCLFLVGCEIATIRPLNPETGKAILEDAKAVFDPISFVDQIWETQVVPAFQDDAVDLKVLLAELEMNLEMTSNRYGHREGNRPYNFLVTGRGQVLAVDTSSRAGLFHVDLEPYDGQADAQLQIGPVIRGTALRDALPFIQFNQFTNQLEYAKVSRALHNRVLEWVGGDLEFATWTGKPITFSGAFTLNNQGAVVITPINVQIED